MGYEKCGEHPNSKANLLKGSNLPRLMLADGPSQRLVISILDEETELDGVKMTTREALLRIQVSRAIDEGDLRACQFLIELAGRNESNTDAVKTATTNPLEQLQSMMLQSKPDDRRKKTNRKRS
jgi:hypothetical protein